MIDIHSHIIPYIDDGAKDIDMTLEMLTMAEKSGTNSIVATPHYFKGYWTPTYDEIIVEVEKLKQIASENKIKLNIYPGQEVFYFNDMAKEYEEGKIGTINKSRYMLIEFPMDKFDKDIFDALYELQIRGVTPIIAHPERYIPLIKNNSMINKFIEEGYLFQLNGGSIAGLFGKEVKKTAEIFLKNNIYSFLGSDAHTNGRRNSSLDLAIGKIDSETISSFRENGEKLINNDEIEFLGKKMEQKKGLFSLFKR